MTVAAGIVQFFSQIIQTAYRLLFIQSIDTIIVYRTQGKLRAGRRILNSQSASHHHTYSICNRALKINCSTAAIILDSNSMSCISILINDSVSHIKVRDVRNTRIIQNCLIMQ